MTNILQLDTVNSTNSYSIEHLEEIADRTIVTAKQQLFGKGRRGREWKSPYDKNVYSTYVIKNPPFDFIKASWIGGLAALFTIRKYIRSAWLKWPNDIYCTNRKIAGVLCESSIGVNGSVNGVVIGIGLNVNMNKNELLTIDSPATSILLETGKTYSIPSVNQTLSSELDSLYSLAAGKGIDCIWQLWKKENYLIGKKIIYTDDAGKSVDAKVLDIKNNGALYVIENDGTMKELFAGDVSIKKF